MAETREAELFDERGLAGEGLVACTHDERGYFAIGLGRLHALGVENLAVQLREPRSDVVERALLDLAGLGEYEAGHVLGGLRWEADPAGLATGAAEEAVFDKRLMDRVTGEILLDGDPLRGSNPLLQQLQDAVVAGRNDVALGSEVLLEDG